MSLYENIVFFFFFFNDTATTEIYTLSLHDALPISRTAGPGPGYGQPMPARLALAAVLTALALVLPHATAGAAIRSCGNARATGGFVIGDVIARRVSCRTAKRVA